MIVLSFLGLIRNRKAPTHHRLSEFFITFRIHFLSVIVFNSLLFVEFTSFLVFILQISCYLFNSLVLTFRDNVLIL